MDAASYGPDRMPDKQAAVGAGLSPERTPVASQEGDVHFARWKHTGQPQKQNLPEQFTGLGGRLTTHRGEKEVIDGPAMPGTHELLKMGCPWPAPSGVPMARSPQGQVSAEGLLEQ